MALVKKMMFRGMVKSFGLGNNSTVITIPDEIIKELGINVREKKIFFDVYTDFSGEKKKIMYILHQTNGNGDQNGSKN